MLDLGRPAREVGGLPLGLDDREPLHFHILPAPPRVRLDDNGLPRVTLLRKLDEGVLVGGLLELELDVGWPDELVEEARLQLVAETGEEEIVLSPVPVVGASAEVFLATRAVPEEEGLEASLAAALAEGDSSSTEDEAPPRFFSTLTTSVPQLNAPHATRFSASLSPGGVRLVEAALASRAAPLGALIRLQVEGLRPGREVLVHVNWARVYEHFSQHHRAGALLYVSEVRQLVETLREQSSIEIVAIEGPRAEGSEDSGGGLDEILQWVQDVLIARFMEPALPLSREPATASLGTTGELLGVGSAYAVKALTQVEEAHATLDFQRPRAVVRTFTAQAHLKDLLPGSSADEHIADGGLQHRWFQIMNFALRPARPLEVDHVREVAGTWAWGNEREALQLTPATAEARADAYMDESPDGRWALDLQITLSDDSPADPGTSHHVGPLHGDSRTLTVDLPRLLGLHRVEVIAPSIEDLISVRVQLRHLRGDAEQDKRVLDLSPGELRIATWFTDFQAGDRVEASPTWLS